MSDDLSNLSQAAYRRFRGTRDTRDLQESVEYARYALERNQTNSIADIVQCIQILGFLLLELYDQTRAAENLDEAINCLHQALELLPPGHPNHGFSFNTLANAASARFRDAGAMQDLDDAINYNRQALDVYPSDHPDRSTALNNLANSLLTRFEKRGTASDLEEAIQFNRQALELRPPGHTERSGSLNNLANCILTRFEQKGVKEDLDEAITCISQALEFSPPGDPGRGTFLSNLANCVVTRFQQTGNRQDLEDAIEYNRQSLKLRPLGHREHLTSLNNLAGTLVMRFQYTGVVDDLDEATKLNHQALESLPPGHSESNIPLGNIASTFITRYHQTGIMKDLDEAIARYRQTLDSCPPGHPKRGISLNNLANAVGTRFDQTGMAEDMEEGISYHRQALELRPPGHPNRSISFSNLANALLTRFLHASDKGDLDEAIECNSQALNLRPPGHPDRGTSFNNLAGAVLVRFKQTRIREDLDEAIHSYRQALELKPPGHPERAAFLMNLSEALSLHQDPDLQSVVGHLLEADSIFPALHPWRARAKSELAYVYLKQHKLGQHDAPSLDVVFNLLNESSNHPTGSVLFRLDVAGKWASLAREFRHESSIRGYTTALALLNQMSAIFAAVDSQHDSLSSNRLGQYKILASDAASNAIAVGRPDIAIECLEQGRTMLWSRMRGYRHPVAALSNDNPQLAEQFKLLSHQLESLATFSGTAQSGSQITSEVQERQYHMISEKWDEVIQDIRKLDGFKDFLKPVAFTTLRKAAAEGPVIVININKFRSDAIIVMNDMDPFVVPLPDASPEALASLYPPFLDPKTAKTPSFSTTIVKVFRNLWKFVVQTIVEKLDELGIRRRSRIWWCPTAELCLLPIHAAGLYMPGQKSLADLYVSSYTATLSALILARSDLAISANPSLLLIAQPDESLPSVEEEVRRVRNFGEFSTLIGAEASVPVVISSLQKNSWVHFACHGHRNPQPFHSWFQLHDGKHLSLLDIMSAQLPDAELAFLSACHAAAVDQKSPDESVNLASALQFCGFRSVVGTLWAMADEDGPDVAEDFYRYMFRNPGKVDFTDAATALNRATREMRKRRGMTLGRWVNFIHIGA